MLAVGIPQSPSHPGGAGQVTPQDLFEFLKPSSSIPSQRCACAAPFPCDPALLRATALRYSGEVDAEGRYHGQGMLKSTVGFTYTGGFEGGWLSGSGCCEWESGESYIGTFALNLPCGRGRFNFKNGDWYDGEVYRGLRHGLGTFHDAATDSKYIGRWVHGEREGQGLQWYSPTSWYDGLWCKNQRHGPGTLQYSSGHRYEGEWQHDVPSGEGLMGWSAPEGEPGRFVELYRGTWQRGAQNGRGVSVYLRYLPPAVEVVEPQPPAGQVTVTTLSKELLLHFVAPPSCVVNRYQGDFANGMRHGFGLFTYNDGSSYEGEWVEGKKHGWGKVVSSLGECSFAHFHHDRPSAEPVDGARPAVGDRAGRGGADEDVAETWKEMPERGGADASMGCGTRAVTASTVPRAYIEDLFGVGTVRVADSMVALKSIILRFHSLMWRLFTQCCSMNNQESCVTAPYSWWTHFIPGELTVMQLIRFLLDAGILCEDMTIADVCDVLADVGAAVRRELREVHVPVGCAAMPWRDRWAEYQERLYSLSGSINYREFVECLIRIASRTYVMRSPGGVPEQFHALAEAKLATLVPPLVPRAVFPFSRQLVPKITAGRISALRELFLKYSVVDGLTPDTLYEIGSRGAWRGAPLEITSTLMRTQQWLSMLSHCGVFRSSVSPAAAIQEAFPYLSAEDTATRPLVDLVATLRLTFAEFVEATLRVVYLMRKVRPEDLVDVNEMLDVCIKSLLAVEP